MKLANTNGVNLVGKRRNSGKLIERCKSFNNNGNLCCDKCLEKSNIESKKSRNKKLNEGKCRDCGQIADRGILCNICADKGIVRSKKRITDLKANNICMHCAKNSATPGFDSCQNCRDKIKEANAALKREVILHYGGICICCNEGLFAFLTIDHINNDGGIIRQKKIGKKKGGGGINYYKFLKNNNYPEGHQILCWNCNLGKHLNKGICPHKGIQIDLRKDHYKVKIKVINYYGGKCNCCAENNILFLTIDHVNGDGAEFRKKHGINGGHHTYLWIQRNLFPTEFQVLCMNCNAAKGQNDQCPHNCVTGI